MRLRMASSVVLIATAFVGVGVLSPASALGARRISGCFAYNGVRYSGLSTNVEYQTISGGWRYLSQSAGHTLSDGCVAYNITGRYRNWHLRIKATAVVPQWRAVFIGSTPFYGRYGSGSYNLGQGRLSLLIIPAAAPSAPTTAPGAINTNEWLNDMTGSPAANNCSSSASPAMQVACYMDQHGLHGNVVTQPRDQDNDGVYDDQDHYPMNASLQ
jgi:hypothetical protein